MREQDWRANYYEAIRERNEAEAKLEKIAGRQYLDELSDNDGCTDAFSTPYGDRRCDLDAGHDGYHVRNDGCGRPEYHWGQP